MNEVKRAQQRQQAQRYWATMQQIGRASAQRDQQQSQRQETRQDRNQRDLFRTGRSD